MPVLDKTIHKTLVSNLHQRFDKLADLCVQRKLINHKEGCSGFGHWIDPSSKCATIGDKTELILAIADLETILAELKKLK